MIRHALAESWPWLALFALGVAGLALFARDPKADEHDLTDYHPMDPEMAALRDRIIAGLKQGGRPQVLYPVPAPTVTRLDDDILPPAPAGMDAGVPLWRELTVATAVPTLTDDEVREKAAEWLREIASEQARAEMAGAR